MDQPQDDIDAGDQHEEEEGGRLRQVPGGEKGAPDDHVVVGRPETEADRTDQTRDQGLCRAPFAGVRRCAVLRNRCAAPETAFPARTVFLILLSGGSTDAG